MKDRLCESADDSRALGRLRIFSRETNDYTIRAEQMRPDVRELLARIEALEAALDEIAHARWPSVNGDDPVKRIHLFAAKALAELPQ